MTKLKTYPLRKTVSARLIARINAELPEVPLSDDAIFYSYRGPKDAGQLSWEALGQQERICSSESMTSLLRADKLATTTPDEYRSKGWEIGSA